MKRLTRIALVLCALSCVFAGCGNVSTGDALDLEKFDNYNPIPPTNTEPNLTLSDEVEIMFPEGISLMTEFSTYPVGVEAINVIWKNDTGETIGFGYGYYLDKKVDNKWVRMGFVVQDEIITIPAIMLGIDPHSQRDWSYELSFYYGFLEAGEYRIATDFYDTFSPSPTGGHGQYRIYAEFNLNDLIRIW